MPSTFRRHFAFRHPLFRQEQSDIRACGGITASIIFGGNSFVAMMGTKGLAKMAAKESTKSSTPTSATCMKEPLESGGQRMIAGLVYLPSHRCPVVSGFNT